MQGDENRLSKQGLDDRRFVRNLDWNLLKIFAEIVRNGGVTNAAQSMSRQQPAISSALKRLEEYIDKGLCDRGPAGFFLTDHGDSLADICKKIEELVFSMQPEFNEIDNEVSLQLRIVAVGNIVSPRLDETISLFAQRYPRAELLVKIAPCPEIEDMIIAGEADIGVCPAPRFDEDLEYTFLFRERHVPVCGRRHSLFGVTLKSKRELHGEAFVIPGTDEANHIREFREQNAWGDNIAGQSLDLNEVKRMLLAGIGIALLPMEFVQQDLDQGTLWPLMSPLQELRDDVYLVTNSVSHRGSATRRFTELIPDLEEEGQSAWVAGG